MFRVEGRVPKQGLTCQDSCNAEAIRVNGNVLCAECGKEYWRHPYCRGAISFDGAYHLHVACDGTHLHL